MATRRKQEKRRADPGNGDAPPATDQVTEICFTIMPFGGWFDTYYSDIFCPAIRAAGLEPHRADDLYHPGTITNDIWAYTQNAKIVLADLTGKNPNVFYELGLAHALTKPAVLVAETIEDVPFDLRGLRVIEYDKNAPSWGVLLRQKIELSIRDVLKSPLDAVLPAFLSVKMSNSTPAVTQYEKELLALKQDVELLRREILPSRTRRPRETISEVEAESLIQDYLSRGIPYSSIVSHLLDRGVPESFTRRKVEDQERLRDSGVGSPTSGPPPGGEAQLATA